MKHFSENLYNFFFNFFETNVINSYFYERSFLSLTNNELFLDKHWLYFSNIISVILISFFIILLGIIFPNKAKIIKFLNLISAFYLLIFFYLMSSEYIYNLNFISGIQINALFQQNHTLYVNFFYIIATITTLIFFLSICDIFYLEENMKIEYTLLVFYVYLSAILLLSSLDFISIIILLECIAFSSYVLVGFERKNKFSTSSALKYLILAAVPSGFFILGISILYNNYGSFYQDYLDLLLVAFDKNLGVNVGDWLSIVQNSYFTRYPSFYSMTWRNGIDFEYTFQAFHYYTNLVNTIFDKFTLLHITLTLTYLESRVEFLEVDFRWWESDEFKELYITYYIWFLFLMQTMSRYLDFVDVFLASDSVNTNHMYPVNLADFLQKRSNKIQDLHVFLDQFTDKAVNGFDKFLGFLSYYRYTANRVLGDALVSVINTSPPYFADLSYLSKMQQYNWTYLWATSSKPIIDFHLYDYENYISKLDETYGPINIILKSYIDNWSFVVYNAFKHVNSAGYFSFYFDIDRGFFKKNEECFINYATAFSEKIVIQNAANSFFFELNYDNIFLSTYLVIIFLLINLSFKITAAPFHFWAPSVYGGSPLPTITFLSVFSKLTIIFLFINLFLSVFEHLKFIWQPILFFLGVLSIIISIIGAFSEKVFKRFFIYSSIGHVGFMVLGIGVLNYSGIQGAIDYLILYIISSFIVWFIVMHLTKKTTHLISFKGLSFNYPTLSLILVIALFSISGLPPMGGFFVKFEIFYSLINSSQYFIAYVLFILTVFSFFYYLRLIKIIYFEENKTIKKNKNLNDIKLRLISILIFVLPLYILLFQEPFFYSLKQIIISSF